jgi:putative FmdB family regulatory protein
MPIYEYRCPNDHTFELFQRMSDAPPGACEVCGAGPVTKVLYPAAIHFKGSGFYSTDYGRGNRKRDKDTDGAGPDAKPAAKTDEKPKKEAAGTTD